MALYIRPDSSFWWMLIEGDGTRKSTGVPVDGGSTAQDRELKRQAQELYALAQTEAAKKRAGLIPNVQTISVPDLLTWYEQHVAVHHRSAARELSMLKTLRGDFAHCDHVAALTAADVKEWMTRRRKQVKPSTVNRELDVLKQALASAVPKYLTVNPIAGLRRFRVDEHEPRVLTPDEEARLLAVADVHETAFLLTAIDTLLRLSSVVYLKWAQVKLDRGVIVPLNAKVSLDSAPISRRVDLALRALTVSSEYVFADFHRRGTGKTSAKNKGIRRFHDLCQKAQIPHGRAANGVTFHCLRHTGATRALQRGSSVRTVMKLGGWKDERTVMRYVHAADSDVRAAAESISQHTPESRSENPALKRA